MGPFKVKRIKVLKSTNSYFSVPGDGPVLAEGAAIMAGFQEAGRGQAGNSWIAEAGKNILMSVYLKPSFISFEEIFALNMITSLSIVEFLSTKGVKADIKWPNDIIVNKRKICGILTENMLLGTTINSSVVGIGLNVNQESFPDFELPAVSMKSETGNEFDVDASAEYLLNGLMGFYLHEKADFDYDRLRENYYKHLIGLNRTLLFADTEGEFRGKIRSVDAQGLLRIEKQSGEICEYAFKEVRFLEL